MAETAAILNPASKVLLPVLDAGCPMADMISAEQLIAFKAQYPGSVVVCYVNSTVEIKALSDICCTSSNAVKVIQSIPPDKTILFVPDRNLGSWAGRQTGRRVITWDGYCPVHQWGFKPEDIQELRSRHPQHKLLVHPECDDLIVQEADAVLSTGGMMKYVETHDQVILATEAGMSDYLAHLYPEKSIIPLNPKAICKNMKKTTLTDVLNALINQQHHIQVEPIIAKQAKLAIDRMLALS